MRICMAATYDIRNPSSWSGTPYSLYQAMVQQISSDAVTTVNLSDLHTPWNEKMNLLRQTDIRQSLKKHTRVYKCGLSEMNPLNSSLLHKYCSEKPFDALLEFGGFLPSKDLPPYYVYSDASHDLTLDYYEKYGYLPYGHSAGSLDEVRRAADFVRKIYQNAQGVFCMSQWMANSMIHTSGVAAEHVHVVYAGANWHNADVVFPQTPRSLEGKKEIHLLLVGVSFQGKGVDLAIQAVEQLNRASDKTYILHICGIRTPFDHV